MFRKQFLLFSFDVEEFDMPLEYGQVISEKEQLKTGYQGLEALMAIVDPSVEATFFTTANFAQHYPDAIRSISERHEIASHTFYHSHFREDDLFNSKKILEEITGKPVKGLRMPRMQKPAIKPVLQAGYEYDSSLNPTFLPGRYNNLAFPRKFYTQNGIFRLPVSVSPILRIPLFWLSFKNFPYRYYLHLVKRTLRKDGYVCLYFHPWEFIPLNDYAIPGYTKKFAGPELQNRFKKLVQDLKPFGDCISIEKFMKEKKKQ